MRKKRKALLKKRGAEKKYARYSIVSQSSDQTAGDAAKILEKLRRKRKK